jgi:hypothetical protein
MPTPFESATLILTLYEQRREETMRKARDYFVTFDPQSFDELMAGMAGPQGAYIRMVIGYWEQAASLVIHGAIDETMFRDATGEYILVFARIQPYLPQIREMFGNPGFAANLEKLALGLPNAQERLDGTLKRMRALVARSKAASGS